MALLRLIVFGLATSVTAVPFFYYDIPSTDPEYGNVVGKLKKVLKNEGLIDPSDIKAISSLQGKNEFYRYSYKASFFTKSGKECFYKWRDILYSTTTIAEHQCTLIPKLLPPKTTTGRTSTTTEDSDPYINDTSEEDSTKTRKTSTTRKTTTTSSSEES